jgi:hypothetical protein
MADTTNTFHKVTLDGGELLANPNRTSTQALRSSFNSTWSNLKLNVPVDDESSNSVNFTQNDVSDQAAGEWRFYGPYVLFQTSSGQLISHFFAKPATTAGLFDLVWNLSQAEQADDPETKPVALRNIAPTED